MEASPEADPSKQDPVFLDTDIIAEHLSANKPISEEKARVIWLMNQGIDNPETTQGGW